MNIYMIDYIIAFLKDIFCRPSRPSKPQIDKNVWLKIKLLKIQFNNLERNAIYKTHLNATTMNKKIVSKASKFANSELK